jgi:tetratricopeptide (TPR) repeat protein
VTCLDDDLVLGLVEGRLAAAVLADVDEHLDGCESCREVISQVARVQAPSRVLERGHTVGRYVIGDLLGAGAMGRVYSAWEPELDRRVALKLLVEPGASARERMAREAQAMARLDHPNVVGVHEVGTSEDGVYVAMDLVEGVTLRAWADPVRPWREVVPVLIEIARGLAAVHAAGVTHRDIKPDNIIIGPDGRARLGDFGLARSGASAPTAAAEPALALGTPASAIAGTPAYMAPEVLRGASADPASDQFSFGVLAFEVLAGKRPFAGATWAALLAAIEEAAVPSVRGAPAWLDDAIHRSLAVTPGDRFPSMAALADHLTARAQRRRPTTWLVGAAAAAAIASGVTWAAVRREPAAASCAVGGAELATVWNPEVKAALAPLGATALASLDAWAGQWATERDAACRAAITAPAPARDRCLDQRKAELSAIVVRLRAGNGIVDPTRASSGAGDRVVDALASLASPSECRAILPGAADPLPLDPAKAASARRVQDELPAARAAIALGDARPVLATTAELVQRARETGHEPTLADALIVRAEALRATSELHAASTAAVDAVVAAERGHDDLLAARAWVVRVATAGDRRDLPAAQEAGAIAAAAVERAGSPPHLVATVLRQRGLIAYNRGLLEEARTLLAQARLDFIALSGASSIDVATAESALGSVARAAGDLDAAEAWHRSAYAIDRTLRTAQHPDLARDLHNIAGVLRLRGKLDEAATTYREALAIEVATRGATSVEAGLTRNSLGLVYMGRKDWDHAREELTAARDILTAAGHGDRAFAHHNLGLVEANRGDHRLALTHYARAAAAYHDTIGDDTAAAIRLMLDRGRAMLAVNDADGAGTVLVAQARDAAAAIPITWIVTEADALLLRNLREIKRPANRPVAVEVSIEPPIRGTTATDPKAAARAPDPKPPEPKRDVGAYGSTQSW